MAATVRGWTPDQAREWAAAWFGPTSDRPFGIAFYRQSAQVGEHSLIAWEGIGDNAGTVLVSLAGAELRRLDGGQQLQLVASLQLLGAHFSRVDAYVDDWDRVVRPSEARAAIMSGDVVTRTKGWGELRSDRRGWETLYVGSRTSAQFLRAYEKAGHQGDGSVARVRWELELKDKAASAYVARLLEAPGEDVALFWGTVRGLVDFRERGGRQHAHGERAPLLPWWALLTSGYEKVRRATAERFKGIEERAAWIARQAARTLATVWLAKGDQWLSDVVSDGMGRLTERDRWQVTMAGVRT